MSQLRRLLLALCLAALGAGAPAAAQTGDDFSDWAAIVVAGDNTASGGGQTEVFDNGRRDLAGAFVDAGFSAQNILQFSVQAEKYAEPRPMSARSFRRLSEEFRGLTQRARGGCLIYFTSHGSPDGIVLGDRLLSPGQMAELVDDSCGKRPTVAVVSACFSGVFVPALEGANRLVMTAARPDRTSFGCGATDRYTYFDDCFLQSMRANAGWQAVARAIPVCVSQRETAERIGPPSEPQVVVGPQMRAVLPLYSFRKPSG